MRLGWILLLVCVAAGATEALVTIRPHSELALPRATLGDVADIDADAATTARLAAIPVVELSTLTPQTLDTRLIQALATRASLPTSLRVTGSGTVTRRARTFPTSELAAAAGATLPADTTWELLRISAGLTVPDSPTLHLVAEALDPGAVGEIPFRIRALDGTVDHGRTLVVLRVARTSGIPVAVRAIRRGQVVGAADLAIERRMLDRGNQAAVGLTVESLAGQIASRDLAAGTVITRDALVIAPVIRAGSTTQAVWRGHGFAVELTTIALADARTGERVNLRRTSDGTVLHGTAQSDGTATLEYSR